MATLEDKYLRQRVLFDDDDDDARSVGSGGSRGLEEIDEEQEHRLKAMYARLGRSWRPQSWPRVVCLVIACGRGGPRGGGRVSEVAAAPASDVATAVPRAGEAPTREEALIYQATAAHGSKSGGAKAVLEDSRIAEGVKQRLARDPRPLRHLRGHQAQNLPLTASCTSHTARRGCSAHATRNPAALGGRPLQRA